MRKAIMACLLGVAAIYGVMITNQALALQRGGLQQPGGGLQQQQAGGQQQGKEKSRPPPPPIPRCPDLGVGTVAFVTEVPGEAPLGPNEIAVSWQVRNDGNTPFVAPTVADTSVALEYTTPAGAQRIAIAPAITTLNEEGRVSLAYNHNVRGVVRGVIPAEAAGRRLRLRLVYASEGSRSGIPDCNELNNIAPIPRLPAVTPVSVPAPSGQR
ncbi:hypothetical protein [Candidatus Viadribacter manganicus]|uniref:CARDB domain-containing protein n=1 Tax=Candidatus Viadribacter manganicus TaxID=1759059 RepID=A0A1B1AJX1_9PROT|nr:hypothetical protein [Candidatus Viadribacter manganicus]ANP46845.1 hypothetical protein ATE48_13435 [Candidatus Viadribacter manganicus]